MAFKSKLEERIAQQILDRGIDLVYEDKQDKLLYNKLYQPDFRLPGGILIETKGYHRNLGDALTKLCSVVRCNPDIDLRIVWSNANMKVPFYKNKKKMTAKQWSEKNGFQWAHEYIPDNWFKYQEINK